MSTRSYPTLYSPFIWSSLIIATAGGFFTAAILSLHTGGAGQLTNFPLVELIQLHGHLQLFGWIGLLLIGVSLHVVPRLAGNPTGTLKVSRIIFLLLLTGILLRSSGVIAGMVNVTCSGMLLEAAGVILYLYIVVKSVATSRLQKNDFRRLGPYFVCIFSGWIILAIGLILQGASCFQSKSLLLSPLWNFFLIDTFVRLTLIPAIFAFGVKMIPVFLGLQAPLWPVKKVGLLLAGSSFLYIAAEFFSIALSLTTLDKLAALGLCGMSLAVIIYIWFLDALFFRILPERISLKALRSDASQQRGRFGDRGGYGRFELFIITGFGWCLIVAIVEMCISLCLLLNVIDVFPARYVLPLRHALLLGGIAHLVLGISHRLLPGLLQIKRLTPELTLGSFLLLFVAAIGRVIPLIAGEWGVIISPLFALSGPLGLIAVALFLLNLFRGRTLRHRIPNSLCGSKTPLP